METTSAGRRARNLPSLTGMRFFAAFTVFVTHVGLERFFSQDGVNDQVLRQGLNLGWTGVEFFFMLSGFVLTWSASSGDTNTRFWRRRVAKVFPNHLVSWALALVLALVLTVQVTPRQFLPSLLLVHTWFPDAATMKSLNLPSWSLCSEVLFYFLFPWLLRLIRRIRADRLWLAAGVCFALIALVPVFAAVALPGGHDAPFNMSFWQHWVVYQLPLSRLPDFLLGVIVARIVQTGQWVGVRVPAAGLLVVLGCVVQYTLSLTVWAPTLPVAVPLALLIGAGATADVRGMPSVFRGRTMVWLGEVSFAFFMLHYLVVHYTHLAIGADRQFGVLAGACLIAALVGVSVLAAWAMYRLVESPVMRRWSKPKHLRRPAGAGPVNNRPKPVGVSS